MKKLSTLLLASTLLCTIGCKDPQNEPTPTPDPQAPTLTLNPSEITFDNAGGTKTITVECSSDDWTVTSDQAWCETQKTDNETITLTAAELTADDAEPTPATITVTAGEGDYTTEKTITAKQTKDEVVPPVDAPFTVTFANTTYTGSDFDITPDEGIKDYVVAILPTLLFGEYTDEDLVDAIHTSEADSTLFNGPQQFISAGYDIPDTEYMVVTYETTDRTTATSAVGRYTYTTPKSELDPKDCTFAYEPVYELTQNAIIKVTVSDPYMLYILRFIPTADVDALDQDYYEEFVAEHLDIFYGLTFFGSHDMILTPRLAAGTSYACVAIPVDGRANVISDAVVVKDAFETSPADDTQSYDRWLGTWAVTSTSSVEKSQVFEFNIVIAEGENEGVDYAVYGFETSENRWLYPAYAHFKATTLGSEQSFFIPNVSPIGEVDEGYDTAIHGIHYMYAPTNKYGRLNGDFDCLAGRVDDDGLGAHIFGATGTVDSGAEFETKGLIMLAEDAEGNMLSYAADPELGAVDGEVFVGPFNLVKVSDDTTLPNAVGSMEKAPSKYRNREVVFEVPYSRPRIEFKDDVSYIEPYKIKALH